MGKKKNDATKENQKLLDRYIVHCKNKGLTQESIRAICQNDLRVFLEFIGDKKLSKVTHHDIEDFLIYCSEVRKNGVEAISRKFSSISQFFKVLVNQEAKGITRNPLDKLDKPKKRKKVRPYLTYEEYEKLIEYVDEENDLRGAALISLMFSSGCRLSEIHQLNIDSLNFSTRRFKVLGKGEKERICFFSEDAKNRIQKYLDSREDVLKALFVSRENRRWSKKSIQDYVKKLGIESGIQKNVHPHLFRHGRAMYLLKQGVALEVIQRLLGHESIATTQIYAHMETDAVQKVIDAVEAA
ncbi:tyrosine-type recombinase/integrase [Anaerosolibacter sp.]|uniref:tyrosine-type recombinase/integrase n=1 Tax=Anaerosolibacter sp. TaxID=1872527 RepID=UPI0039EEE0EC